MGVLDDAIESAGTQRIVTSMRVSRLIDLLSAAGLPATDVTRLHDMLAAPVEEWGHTTIVRVLKHCCAEYGIDCEDARHLNYKNIEDARKKLDR